MVNIAHQFASTLKEIGVRFVFGVPSGSMIDYIEAIRETEGIDFVLVGHESTAAFMGAVQGRLTGIPGVCFGTFGPGATNLATGVGCAFLDRYPLIAFTDEMPDNLRGRAVQMNINHQALFLPITKWTTRLERRRLKDIFFEAAHISTTGIPGPVHIGVPVGIGSEEANQSLSYDSYKFREKRIISSRIINSANEKVKELFSKSRKPIIVIGLDAVRANVKTRIIEIAEKFHIPVVLTPMAKGMFPENHPLYIGVLFHALSDQVAKTYREADLVIGIGYDPVEINYEDWMPDVLLIHINLYPADVDVKLIPYVLNVVNEIKDSLDSFLEAEFIRNDWDITLLQKRKEELFQKLEPPAGTFGPRMVIAELRKALPQDGILTVDVGVHLHLAGQQWQTPSPEKLLMTNGWSSMGFAVPAAMAAKLLYPELPVACLMGDGGFRMMAGELATAKRLNLAIVFIVILDNSLSLIRIKQEKKLYNSDYGTSLGSEPYPAPGNYFGVPVIRVDSKKSYQEFLTKAFTANGPVVIEAIVDGSEYDELVLKSNK